MNKDITIDAKEFYFHFERIRCEMPGDPYQNTVRYMLRDPTYTLTKEERAACKLVIYAQAYKAEPGQVLRALQQQATATTLRNNVVTLH